MINWTVKNITIKKMEKRERIMKYVLESIVHWFLFEWIMGPVYGIVGYKRHNTTYLAEQIDLHVLGFFIFRY